MRLNFFKFYPWKIKLEYNEYLYPPLPTLRAIELWSTGKPREISQAISYFKMAALSVSQLSMSWLALLSYLDKSGLKNGLALLGKQSNTDFIIFKGKNSCLEAELLLIVSSCPITIPRNGILTEQAYWSGLEIRVSQNLVNSVWIVSLVSYAVVFCMNSVTQRTMDSCKFNLFEVYPVIKPGG